MNKIFNKLGKININEYLKFYEKSKDYKDDKDSLNLNNVNNVIICTKKVFSNIPFEKVSSGKYKDELKLDFNKIINIGDKNISYDVIREFWGAKICNDGIIKAGIDEDELIHISFETMYYEPYEIINYLLKKYKKDIIWFSKVNSLENTKRGYLFYYKNNKIIKLIEKEKSEEEKQEEENNQYFLTFFIPYHLTYKGLYVDCYAKDSKSEKYICSCYKEALKNKLIMFDNYLKHDYCLNDRKELLLKYLGLPDHYEKIIKEAPIPDNYIDYLQLFKFEDKLCPVCNKVKIPDCVFYLNNGTSKFKQRYMGEIEKRFSLNGIVESIHIYQGNYYEEVLLSPKNKELLFPSVQELLEELNEYNLNLNIRKELSKFNNLPEDIKKYIKCDLHYDLNNETFNCYKYITSKNICIDFIDALKTIYDKKFKIIKKEILDEIHKIDKFAMDYTTLIDYDYGINIWLKRQNEILHIELYSDILIINEINGKKVLKNTYGSNIDLFATIMEIISSYRINMICEKNTYDEWIICNGKKQNITERDGIRGIYSPIAINHSLIYLKNNAIIDSKSKSKNISDILDKWLP